MVHTTEKTLSVLSLNCWGLNIVAKKRRFRLQAIANSISYGHYDIVALQEVWMWEDFDYIKEKTEDQMPYSKYFHSGTLGSGLVILSRFPILLSSYLKFTLAGKPLKVLQGDFYVGKGCGCVCVDHPELGLIDVYTTHLQAGYGDHDEYEAQRITECWQIANAVRSSAAQGRHIILAGDFNSIPTSNCYQILKNHGFMTDSWLELHHQEMADNMDRFERNELSASECVQLFGITCDSPLDTWTKHFLKQQPYAKDVGDRLDYIFYRRTPQITCEQSTVAMEQYIPDTQMSFSDHFAVHSIFTISAQDSQISDEGVYAPRPKNIARPDYTRISTRTLNSMLKILEKDLIDATMTANKLLILFGFSLLFVFGLYIAQLTIPTYYDDPETRILSSGICSILLVSFSIIGTVSLVVGFVFGRMEQRSLRQYMIDIKVCLDNSLNMQQQQEGSSMNTERVSFDKISFRSSEGLTYRYQQE